MKISDIKKRLLSIVLTMVLALGIVPQTTVFAADDPDANIIGGQLMAYESDIPVYDSPSFTNRIGTIYKYEGYTGLGVVMGGFYVEYSTPSGTKRGYTKQFVGDDPYGATCLARVTSSTAVYYGTSTTVNPIVGNVYAGEYVTVLAKNDNWIYVEYNTNQGRKRGYMSYTNVKCFNRPGVFPDIYTHGNPGVTHYVSGTYTVYTGLSSHYAPAGSISNENITVLAWEYIGVSPDEMSIYIEYNVPGSAPRKSGFIVFDKYPELVRELDSVI